MDIRDCLTRDNILLDIAAADYGEVLRRVSVHFAHVTERREAEILHALETREARGFTGIGHGVALPHARIDGLSRIYGVYMRLAAPVSAASPDGKPITSVMALLAPTEETGAYLRAVGKLAAILKNAEKREMLANATDKQTVYAVLTSEDA
jgi:PTS system nitrogen regulatory IIA component